MEENTSLLDTKVSDLTVKQTLVVQLVAPIVVVGGFALAGGICSMVGSIVKRSKKQELAVVDSDTE